MDKGIEPILDVKGVCLSFGGNMALSDVSFNVMPKEILAIIGPNGAGKTCILNCINGFYRPNEGNILLDSRDITRISPDMIAKLGVSRTFQQIELYTGLNVIDNIMSARHVYMNTNIFDAAMYFGRAHAEEVKHRKVAEEILDFLEMSMIRKKVVGTLPYGVRKRVELGRALALEPKILLLDEPMAGMNVDEKEDMARFILDIESSKHIPIILVEHDMGVVMDISDRVIAIDYGKQIAEGTPSEIRTNIKVIDAYLGKEE